MARPSWNFPSNSNGREDGLNDPGIETFRDHPLSSLAREIPQNSLDADDPDSGKPVEVHFELLEPSVGKIPDADGLRRTLAACRNYWKANEAARKFFTRAEAVMKGKYVRVLKIQDFNTTGLMGPFESRTSDWFKLTKAIGASDKAGGKAGSFGIGKHAPFACSELRTVLYGTVDKRGEFAFQGVSKLVTHRRGAITTQGTGYYGMPEKNSPILDPRDVDKLFKRSEVGTDVYILGFSQNPEWEQLVTKGLIESFFVAINAGALVAKIGKTLLNQASLPQLVAKFAAAEKGWPAAAYYEALTSEEAQRFPVDDFEGLGPVELRAMVGPDFPKKVAMVRSGMKIKDRGHFQTPLRFAGVFIPKGNEINALLRSLEPPSHGDWVADRHPENPSYARSILKALNSWLHDCIRQLGGNFDVEQLDAEGISQFLPDDVEEQVPPSADAVAEGERNEPEPEIPVAFRSYKPEHARGAALTTAELDGDQPMLEGDEPFGQDDQGNGDGEGQGEEGGAGEEAKAGANGQGPGPAPRRIALRRVRVFCSDEAAGRYKIICVPEESGTGFLAVRVVGEVGQETAPITEFTMSGSAEVFKPPRAGVVGPVQLVANATLDLEVVLEGAPHCALGVTAHAR